MAIVGARVLTGVSPLLSARIILDYVIATLKSTLAPAKNEHSFEEWGVRNLGRTLYDLCFGLYSARVWGLPTSQISSKQAQRVAKLNLKNIILRTLGIKPTRPPTSRSTCIRARGSACCTRAWRQKCAKRGTAS